MIGRLARFFGAVSFHRGLALGALVGSAIAGSTLWTRIRRSRSAGGSATGSPGTPPEPTSL
jgi:hypothetical protein